MKRAFAPTLHVLIRRFAPALFGCVVAQAALAQDEGGLYIAGSQFSFEQAANRGLAQNAGGQRFFLLTLPPQAQALTTRVLNIAAD
jgi:hypothetical protein